MIGYLCPHSSGKAALAQPAVTAEGRAVIERKVRRHLQLPADAPLGPAEFARVTELDLTGLPITEATLAWLADAAKHMTKWSRRTRRCT